MSQSVLAMLILFTIVIAVTTTPTTLGWDNPFIVQITNTRETVQCLQELAKTSDVEEDIVTIVNSWAEQLDNSLLFENPVTNFLMLDMIKYDIIHGYGPPALLKECQRTVIDPSEEDIRKTALLLQEMVDKYNMPLTQGVAWWFPEFLMITNIR